MKTAAALESPYTNLTIGELTKTLMLFKTWREESLSPEARQNIETLIVWALGVDKFDPDHESGIMDIFSPWEYWH